MKEEDGALPHRLPELGVSPPRSGFLPCGASRAALIRAAAENHTEWFAAFALALGGEIRETNGVLWILTPKMATVPFPRLSKAIADETLDAILAECRERKVSSGSCWSLTPSRPKDLGARLAARGFEWGWRPHWMALDLHNMRSEFTAPEGLRIAVEDEAAWDPEVLPLFQADDDAPLRVLSRAIPRRMWHFGAWLNGDIVGHVALFVTTGSLGAAGIYNVGVRQSVQNRGIGKAILIAACEFARSLGCHYALLNSAADAIYTRVGFESLGYGQAWWIHAEALAEPPPDRAEVAFAQSIGQGDIAALDALDRYSLPRDLNAPLSNGMSPMELAVRSRKPESAAWLEAHGARLDILHAWDLGWKDRARQMLRDCPEIANRRAGDWQTTPLHDAVQRDDIALARLLLTANPDLSIEDAQFHGIPLGWAHHLHRPRIKALLEQYQARGAGREARGAGEPA